MQMTRTQYLHFINILFFTVIVCLLLSTHIAYARCEEDSECISPPRHHYIVKEREKFISYGDKGKDVVKLQKNLQDLGYLKQEPDGSFGVQTRKALHMYQTQNGLSIKDNVLLSVFNTHKIKNTQEVADTYLNINGYGTAGRLVVPELGISVALFWCDDYNGQAITDAYDSAAFHFYYHFVADHSDQTFATLPNAYKGMRGYVEYADGSIQNIICTGVGSGINDGECIYDFAGRSMYEFSAFMTIYTCTYDWMHIFTSTWELC